MTVSGKHVAFPNRSVRNKTTARKWSHLPLVSRVSLRPPHDTPVVRVKYTSVPAAKRGLAAQAGLAAALAGDGAEASCAAHGVHGRCHPLAAAPRLHPQ
jgi:hypothetical protein